MRMPARSCRFSVLEGTRSGRKGTEMERELTGPRNETIECDDLLLHEWRTAQLTRLGIPFSLAQAVADYVDWHQVANLVRHGCPPRLALRIAR